MTALESTKPIEAGLVHAQLLAVQGRGAEAARVVAGLLETAPPGFAGWSLPVEPFILQATDLKAFATTFSLLAERAPTP